VVVVMTVVTGGRVVVTGVFVVTVAVDRGVLFSQPWSYHYCYYKYTPRKQLRILMPQRLLVWLFCFKNTFWG